MNIQTPSRETIAEAARLLKAGRLVAFPTETVYGLGADATSDEAVAEIFSVKGRPSFNPLIVHVHSVEAAWALVEWNEGAEKLAQAFWPGPLTLVLRRASGCPVSLLASAGGDTLALRMPAHALARELLAAAGVPVAAPSANRSGRVSPTLAEHVREELADAVPMILDGGACEVGIESTVVDMSADTPALLRPGFITRDQLEKTLGVSVHLVKESSGAFKSPGMLASHYAPSLPVRLNATQVYAKEALMAFGSQVPKGAAIVMNLSETGNLKEAAARLFLTLRSLDRPHYTGIAVMPIPEEGLGLAINDRLKRAAILRIA